MRATAFAVAVAAAAATTAAAVGSSSPAAGVHAGAVVPGEYRTYLDPTQPVEARVEDLMSRMTLVERQNQLFSVHNVDAGIYVEYASTSFGAQKLSGFSETTAADLVTARNKEQEFFVNHSRLHIPLAWHQETLNSCGPQATLFPLPVNIGSSWNVTLARLLGEAIGRECRALGIDAAYSPEVNLYTDPRNGRLQEGFSEDPRLTAELAVAQVLGEQGDGPGPLGPRTYLADDKVAAVAKHYIAYGGGAGGINSGPAHLSAYAMRDIYLAPWRSMVQRAGLRALMRSHEQWDHWPVHASTELPQWIESIGFNDSWSISDCGDIVNLVAFQIAPNNTWAGALALRASVDVENQCPPGCFAHLTDAIAAGVLDEATLNRSVARVLRHKFSAGVFDGQMFTNASLAPAVLRSPAHLALALDAARQSVVLLKNGDDDGTAFASPSSSSSPTSSLSSSPWSSSSSSSSVGASTLPLPLDPAALAGKTVAVVGPNGGCAGDPNAPDARCDGATPGGGCQAQCSLIGKTFHEIGDGVAVPTVFQTVKAALPAAASVSFARGADINTNVSTNAALAAPAIALAQSADLVLVVVGDSMQSASENARAASVFNDGGGGDRDSLDLPGSQQSLLASVLAARERHNAAAKVVVVLVCGRQVTFDAFRGNPLLAQADAVVAAWRGGEFAARAIWDVLSGEVNPSGRLSQSWPRSVGQLGGPSSPNLHTVVADWGKQTDQFERSYFYSVATPLFPFGWGLSYTSYAVEKVSVALSPAATAAQQAGSLDALLPRESDAVVKHTGPANPVVATVNVTVRNTGPRAGVVTLQVYAHDPSNVGAVRYYWRLLAFAQAEVPAGAELVVPITITGDALAFPDRGDGSASPRYPQRVFGGEYQLQVAQSALDPRAVAAKMTL